MDNWFNVLRSHRSTIADRVREIGQAKVSKDSGLSEMRVSRFVRGVGADDAKTMYKLAYAVGLALSFACELSPSEAASAKKAPTRNVAPRTSGRLLCKPSVRAPRTAQPKKG